MLIPHSLDTYLYIDDSSRDKIWYDNFVKKGDRMSELTGASNTAAGSLGGRGVSRRIFLRDIRFFP